MQTDQTPINTCHIGTTPIFMVLGKTCRYPRISFNNMYHCDLYHFDQNYYVKIYGCLFAMHNNLYIHGYEH